MDATIMSAAQLICDLIVPSMAAKINSIWNNEEQIKELADTIDLIRDVLYDVKGKRFQQESMKKCYKRLRNAFLDAEDFLDLVQTLKMKKDLEARILKEEKEEIDNKANGKVKLSVRLVGIKLKPLKKKALRFFSKKNQAKYALEVNNTIAKVRKNLDAIAEDMHKFGSKVPSNSLVATQTIARASGPYVNPTNIIGRDGDKRKIVELLLRSSVDEQKIPVVSIVACGGMGKTTTTKLVYNDKSWQESCQFEYRLWVSDSKKLYLKALLKHILKSICPKETDLDHLDEDHLMQRIVETIQGKRFLLVLDDVENENPFGWDNLKGLLDCGSKESRILVTTRSRKVAKVVGSSKSTHELKGLSKEDSSQLFGSFAFGGTRDKSLIEIGDLIVEKCCGVPLAIKVVGSLLRDESKRKWEYFRDYSLTEKIDEGNQIMDILKLSYDDLDPTLKQCFSFCALFPKNGWISKETLRDIWMANVRFRTGHGETVEDACDKSLRILYNRCFLEAEMEERDHDDTHHVTHDEWDGVAEFKLHDLIHDLVKEVAGAEILLVGSDELIIEEDVRHIMLDYDISTFEPKGRRIRNFLIPAWYDYNKILNIDKLVLDCPVVRFLDLSYVKENLIESIGKLVHLRCLRLSHSGFQTLPHSTFELINLRKLELASCKELTQLPSRMGELTCLEVLDLSHCSKLEKLPRGIEKLMNLKKLLLRGCYKLTQLPPRMGALTSLEVLDIIACSQLKELPSGIMKLVNLKKLWLKGCGLVQMPSGMGALLGVCEPAMFIVSADLKELNHTARLEELCHLSDLPVELEIDFRGKGMAWIEGGDGDETLTILLNKKSLRKLKISWQWQQNPGEDVEDEVGKNQMEVLGKLQPPTSLEELTLLWYHRMAFPGWMPRDGFASVLPNLASLSLWYCKGFRYLPSLRRLERLRHLNLCWLRSLEYIVEEEEESDLEATSYLPQLESLELCILPKFKGWRKGEDTNESVVLPSLLRIKIWECPNLTAPSCLLVLKAFDLSLWSSFDSLFDQACRFEGMFILSKGKGDSLKLEIRYCKLTERASSCYIEEALRGASHRLTHLTFSYCSGLKTVLGLHHLTTLRQLWIQSCCDFTWEQEGVEEEQGRVEEEEVGDDMQTTPHHMDSTTTPPSSTHHLSWKRVATLQELTLDGLPKLLTLPEGLQYVTSLHKIHIRHCENLQVPDWAHPWVDNVLRRNELDGALLS